jgi:hypothetical protein
MENGDGYELFAVYGISIEYPSSWSVEVGQLKRDQGVVSFRSGARSARARWLGLLLRRFGGGSEIPESR